MKKIKAISLNDFENHGCIKCGGKITLGTKFGNSNKCCFCGTEFVVINQEPFVDSEFTELDGTTYHVECINHPRHSAPTHNSIKLPKFVDKKLLKEGEEVMYSCGICCWTLTGFVPDIATAKRIKNMFNEVLNDGGSGIAIEEINSVPKVVTIVINPCDNISIDKLNESIKKDGVISKDKIIKSK